MDIINPDPGAVQNHLGMVSPDRVIALRDSATYPTAGWSSEPDPTLTDALRLAGERARESKRPYYILIAIEP